MNQSISIAISVIKGYNTDSAHYSNTTVDDIDDDEPEDQQTNKEEVKDLAFSVQNQLNIINSLIENCAKYNEAVKQKLKKIVE